MPDDTLTFTLRLHDPKEKLDSAKSTSWAVRNVPREDLAMPLDQFVDKYVKPAFLDELKKFFEHTA